MPKRPVRRRSSLSSAERLRKTVRILEEWRGPHEKRKRVQAAMVSLEGRIKETEQALKRNREQRERTMRKLIRTHSKVIDSIDKHMEIAEKRIPERKEVGKGGVQITYPEMWKYERKYRKPHTPLVKEMF